MPGRVMNARRVVVLVVSLLGLAITLRAGFWQMDRAAQKEIAQARQQARAQAQAWTNAELLQGLPALAGQPQPADMRDQPVQLTGHWLTAHTVYLDNRSMDGRAGFYVASPLALADGAVVWVQRGWAPRDATDRTRLPTVQTPSASVQVQGRLAAGLSQTFALGGDAKGAIRQNLDFAQMQAPFKQPVLSMVVVQTDAPSDGLLRHWPPPASGADKNRAYAVQWFAMAGLILVLYVWFQILRPLTRPR